MEKRKNLPITTAIAIKNATILQTISAPQPLVYNLCNILFPEVPLKVFLSSYLLLIFYPIPWSALPLSY